MKKGVLLVVIAVELLVITYLFNLNSEKSRLTSFATLIPNSTNTNEFPRNPINFIKGSGNPKISRELIPNFEQEYDGYVEKLDRTTHVKINSDGFRDREFSVSKPLNTFRIIVLGDSFTFGQGLELNETFNKILETRLNSLNDGKVYEVMNFGVGGYNTLDEVEFFKEKGLKYKPDVVIIGFFHNDFEDNFEIKNRISLRMEQGNFNRTNISKYEYETNLNILMSQVVGDFDMEVFNNTTKFEYYWEKIVSQPLANLSDLSKFNNFTVVIATLDYAELSLNQKKLLIDIAAKYGWHFIQMRDALAKYEYQKLVIGKLDHHYNYFAHELIASKLYGYLINKNLLGN